MNATKVADGDNFTYNAQAEILQQVEVASSYFPQGSQIHKEERKTEEESFLLNNENPLSEYGVEWGIFNVVCLTMRRAQRAQRAK